MIAYLISFEGEDEMRIHKKNHDQFFFSLFCNKTYFPLRQQKTTKIPVIFGSQVKYTLIAYFRFIIVIDLLEFNNIFSFKEKRFHLQYLQ